VAPIIAIDQNRGQEVRADLVKACSSGPLVCGGRWWTGRRCCTHASKDSCRCSSHLRCDGTAEEPAIDVPRSWIGFESVPNVASAFWVCQAALATGVDSIDTLELLHQGALGWLAISRRLAKIRAAISTSCWRWRRRCRRRLTVVHMCNKRACCWPPINHGTDHATERRFVVLRRAPACQQDNTGTTVHNPTVSGGVTHNDKLHQRSFVAACDPLGARGWLQVVVVVASR
jgi:hypothetical protein